MITYKRIHRLYYYIFHYVLREIYKNTKWKDSEFHRNGSLKLDYRNYSVIFKTVKDIFCCSKVLHGVESPSVYVVLFFYWLNNFDLWKGKIKLGR